MDTYFRVSTLVPFLLALCYAPLAYGATTSQTLLGLDILLGIGVVLWLVEKVRNRERFHLAPVPLILVGLLGLIAVLQVVNPHSIFDPRTWDLRPLEGGLPVVPRTTDQATSLRLLPHLLILGAGLVALMDLAHSRRSRWMLLRGIALSGLLVAFLGMVQKAAGGDSLFWGHLPEKSFTYFGAFRYHAHATAYLNLCWPAAMALVIRASHEENFLGRNLWGVTWILLFAAIFVNTSKFGHAMALPLLLLAGLFFWRHVPGEWTRINGRTLFAFALILMTTGALAIPSLWISSTLWEKHWTDGVSFRGRIAVYETAWQMAREAPLFGFGTGSFRILFPYYALSLGDRIEQGIWSHVHQDYLQTAIEWGLGGVVLWVALYGVPVARQALRSLGRHADLTGTAALVGAISVLGHALVDFPLQIGAIQLLFLVYLAMLWRPHHRGEDHHRRHDH